jgi:hypothetical protein
MANGISIHIGLNSVDPAQYAGWDGKLAACEFDAKDMQTLADKRGYKSTLLLTKDATSARVIEAISAAARELKAGDQLLLTYSGHGGQLPDTNGDEPDGLDETWALFDRQLVDDELYALWSKFRKGVSILMLSDSCHSGTVAKDAAIGRAILANRARPAASEPRFRIMPAKKQKAVYQKHKELYDGIQAANLSGDKAKVNACVALISGCQDNQLSGDGARNGVFTAALLKAWNDGKFKGSLRLFVRAIGAQMPPWQSPNYFRVGAINVMFEMNGPFALV